MTHKGDSASLAALLEGARAFRRKEYLGDRQVMAGLAAAQTPDVMMVACADSRVDPAVVCGAGPGTLFMVRNVANLVPARNEAAQHGNSVRSALEYGVRVLCVSHVVVLGHAGCGGIAALIDSACGRPPELEFLGPWLETAGGVCEQVLEDLAGGGEPGLTAESLRGRAGLVERRAVRNSVDNLRTYPWIRERLEAGTLALHGWWFDLRDGRLWTSHPDTGAFRPAEDA